MKQFSQRSNTAAFSLPEILLTAALVAILAWFLFPAFTRASLGAAGFKSLNRIRNLQLANIAYAADHNQWYVAFNDTTGTDPDNSGTGWYTNTAFRAYLGFRGKISGNSLLWPAEYLSPKAPMTNGSGLMNRSYGYNSDAFEGKVAKSSGVWRLRSTQIFRPGETLAFADALNWWVDMASADQYRGIDTVAEGPKGVAYRYGDRAAVVYFDGSAGLLFKNEVKGNGRLWMNQP